MKGLKAALSFSKAVSDWEADNTEYLVPAQELYQWIIKPLEVELKRQNITNLVFVVDKKLRSLPFAALHDGKKFLIENYSIGVMPGLTLTNSRFRSLKNSNVLALGISETNLGFASTPFVEIEIANIMKIWKGQAFLNKEATLDKIQSRRQNLQIIHIAAKAGLGNDKTQGQSSNQFVEPEPFITLWNATLKSSQFEKMDWDIPPTELLTLSGCDTGLGTDYGLAGSAIRAGIKSVLGSLYIVIDDATMVLMSEFYRNLKSSPIKAEALRQAQLAMLKGKIPDGESSMQNFKWSHPFYWASFTMIGSPW